MPIGAAIRSSAHFINDRQSLAAAAAAVNPYIYTENKKFSIKKRFAAVFALHLLSHASAVAQGIVVRAMSAYYWKSLSSALCRNLTPQHTTTKTGKIDAVGDLKKCANFHCDRLDMGTPTRK
jgi:hypothetical protein